MNKELTKKCVIVILLLAISVLSFTKVASYASNPENHKKAIEKLDEKRDVVLKMTAASTGTAVAITLLPGDTATPIAEKMTDLSGYFLVILGALFLEKYMLTLSGLAAFKVLVPMACVLLGIRLFSDNSVWTKLAIKVLGLAAAILLLVPTSVAMMNVIEDTYDVAVTEVDDVSEEVLEEDIKEDTKEEAKEEVKEDAHWYDSVLNFAEKVKDKANDMKDKVEDTVSAIDIKKITSSAEEALNRFIEGIAVMIVTSCVVPVLVLVFYVWLIKTFLSVDIHVEGLQKLRIAKKKEDGKLEG
ncbi:MAG: hypothetical protein K6A30_04260 [Lachnospiraceae bacterium]|nr:hypothetical protein [Lachnospiraceae bacterium]